MRYTCQTSPRFIKKPFFNIHPITQSVLVIIGMSMSGVSAHAATSEAANGESESTLPSLTFTTTATKTPTLVKNTIAQTTVIDEEQLQRYRGQSVMDVLRNQPGLTIKQSGGDGTLSNFYMRGFDNKQILVLIDGIRYSSVSAGGAALTLLPADQIDRIEIIQGASGSSLYGTDAMGGVIQVFTKGQNATQSNTSVTLGAGSENSYKAQVSGQYVNNGTTLSLSVGLDKTDGIDASLPTAPYNIHHPDKDGFKSNNYSLVAKHKYNDNLEVGLSGLVADSTTHYDSSAFNAVTYLNDVYPNTYSDQKNGAATAYVTYNLDKLTAQLKYGQSFDKSTAYDGNSPTGNKFDTTQNQANLQLSYKLPLGQILGGAEWLKQQLDSTTRYQKADDRTIKSGYIGYQLNQPMYDLQAHVRHDDNSDYGNKTTYNVGVAYRISPNSRIGGSYATGFRAPTFNDIEYGVANLKPEASKNTELFIENTNDNQTTRLTGFHSTINDKIYINPNNNYLSQNFERVKINGLTLASDWQLDKVITGGSYTYQSVKNDKGDNKDKYLPYMPKNQANLYVGYRQPKFDIRAEAQYSADRYTNAANTKTLDNYTLINLIGDYYVNPNLSINARINNLTDKDYQTSEGYRQKGINSFISLTYQWF